ncbi:MAG: 2,3-bisphosphoglycerate-independent phosphoglycerate mutase [Alphaproteobacteria bacterium]|nr:2,3-bisphosphoglycerate-independent phosphoglycerate mutase [Alphaproteobacteria bacterium]
MTRPKPVVLMILDGWGHNHSPDHNAIAAARTPNMDALMRDYPHGLINASELHVGLPEGQMGNSEVGHMNIGSGRVIMQELPKIDAAIANGALEKQLAQHKMPGTMHLLGLLSPGGVHSHQMHMAALANMLAAHGTHVYVHLFLDGRDTPPQSALEYIAQFERDIAARANIEIATVSGRYYAMDRDKRWDRVSKAYETLVSAEGERFASAHQAVEEAYSQGITDEFIKPYVIGDYAGMIDGDGLLCANFRADRVREILSALLITEFPDFARSKTVRFSSAIALTEYSSTLAKYMTVLFPPESLTDILGEVVSKAGLKQLRIAETEKYAHVTFFFNGGREQEFPGEERILVPSPKVATYDLQPEMSAPEVTDKLVASIEAEAFDLIVVNYANTDMVGHSGNIAAATQAVEAVDACVGRVVEAALARGGAVLITADHGNAEMMYDDDTRQPHTAHTLNLVPAILISKALYGKKITIPEGRLGDVAPTILQWLQLPQPPAMTGTSLLKDYAA